MILKQHWQVIKLSIIKEVLEIDESDADRMFRLTLKLVSFFGKFRFGDREFKSNIEFLKLS